MTEKPEPEDTCRPVEVDGETIRVRGAEPLTGEAQAAVAEIVRVARAKLAAEPPPVRQQIRAVAFNAVAPALKRHDEWLRLTVRRTVADAVLAAIEDHLDLGDAEAWCKICRRVWDGKAHQCEGDAEQRLARLRDSAASLHSRGIDAMSASFVLDIIDGGADEPARTTAKKPTTSGPAGTATEATGGAT